ncbi:Hypothetical predicted protein [Paramuricea clavata]|uniref:Uncharacterized protein n=1 Tax=Paramuricea clavata TaxID=317549 RepID=A0A6S7I3Z3_PARCT|nr:Hypothetical predicted protein [Paramuricea clavata]
MTRLCIAKRLFSKIYFCMIADAVKIHFQSRTKLARNPITPRKKLTMCMRSRRERLLEMRLKVATEEEQEEFGAALKVEYISEDADASDGGWCHMKLNWRADDLTQFFGTLDIRANERRKDHVKERTKRTHSALSRKRAPNDAPAWAVKPVETAEIAGPVNTNRTRGRGIRTRGGGRGGGAGTGPRSTARRTITYAAQEVLNSISK